MQRRFLDMLVVFLDCRQGQNPADHKDQIFHCKFSIAFHGMF